MPSRVLSFPVFDADNHLYETTDAFTKYLPDKYAGLIRYVEVSGRTKIAVRNVISDYIPNPTFEVVAAPGAQEEFFKHGNPDRKTRKDSLGKGMKALPGFRDPAERIALMDDLGIDRALMWPTLASLLEERIRDDPGAIQAAIHAFNQWMVVDWSFNYQDRIFPVPVINLADLEGARRELDFVLSHGARVILIRPAPAWTHSGPKSPGLVEYDPFWSEVESAGILVGMHSSDSGYQRYYNEWEGAGPGEMMPFRTTISGFQAIVSHHNRPVMDAVASMVGHGVCTRFPRIPFAPIENGSNWVRPMVDAMEYAWSHSPSSFDENPVDAFRRCFYIHPFHEENPRELIEFLGADRVLFGSDYPHPEGMSDPISFVDDLAFLSEEHQAKVMGGNLAELMHVPA